jgi:hypothetical protein
MCVYLAYMLNYKLQYISYIYTYICMYLYIIQ